MSLTVGLFNSGLFEGGIFNGGIFQKSSTEFPGSLFSGGYVGALLDINDFSLLYTTDAGSTHVAAVSDAVGRAVTKDGGTVNALQSTASLRPIIGQWPSGGRYHLYHDRVDDKLTLAGMPAGTYTIGTASFSGVQVYENVYTAGTLTIPGVDFTELLIINRSLTTTEKTALYNYLSTKTPTTGPTEVLRIYCYSSSVNLSITESADSGATWLLSDGQTANGTSCVKTITPPQSIILSATNKGNITSFSFNSKSLYGQLDLSSCVNMVSPRFDNNQFSGTLDLSSCVNLVNPLFFNNQFSGTLDLSSCVNLVSPYFFNNQFSGTLDLSSCVNLVSPYFFVNKFSGTLDLSSCVNLVSPSFYNNQFSGTLDLSSCVNLVSPSFYNNKFSGTLDLSSCVNLVSPRFDNNQFSGFSGTVSATLANLNLANNMLTSTAVNNVLAALEAAGRTSASGTCIVDLRSNSAPTGQGITDKATLQSRGWTVYTD